MPPRPDENLYAQILGPAWHALAPSVRAAHQPGAEKRGEFTIVHGRRFLAGILARWSRLPRPATTAPTLLRIVAHGDRQRWERTFDGTPLITTQWADPDPAAAGRLIERIGAWELTFRLRVGDSDGALFYEQSRARYCLGPLRLPLPWSPRVIASETPDGPARVRISVQVRLPVLGPLIAYHGWLAVDAPASSPPTAAAAAAAATAAASSS